MQYKHIKVNSLLNRITKKDRLFGGDYTVDPYQNCEFGCLYCDSSFDKTIYIKSNAEEILNKELETAENGTIILGSVHDPYQKIEQDEKKTKNLLKIIQKRGFSCHILTKSDLVLRDIDILSQIDNPMVTISMVSTDENISNFFEPNTSSPRIRLETIEKLNQEGVKAGLAVIPVLPFFIEEEIENLIRSAISHQAQYILHKHLELKGDQKMLFLNRLKKFFPNVVKNYEQLYISSYLPDESYIVRTNKIFNELCIKYQIRNRV